MKNQTTRVFLAAIQAVLGWEWLMSGINKVISGNFPQGLGDFLNTNAKNNHNTWYVGFLQLFILPRSVLYGYIIEWTEILIAIVLLVGAVILIFQARVPEKIQQRCATGYGFAVVTALLVGAFLTINFHFVMGGWILPTFNGSSAFGEGVDLDALLPPISVIVSIANILLVKQVHDEQDAQEEKLRAA